MKNQVMQNFSKPTVLVREEVHSIVEENSIFQISFDELTGNYVPWEICPETIEDIESKFHQIESMLHTVFPEETLTCFLHEKGAYWLLEDNANLVFQSMKLQIDSFDVDASMPVWKYTTAELLSIIFKNLRRQILCTSYDFYMLKQIKICLEQNYQLITNKFHTTATHLYNLLEEIKNFLPKFYVALLENCVLYERSLITQKMFTQQELSPQDMNYTHEQLRQVQLLLEKKCKTIRPKFKQEIKLLRSHVETFLCDSNKLQVTRVYDWDMTFANADNMPPQVLNLGKIIYSEKEIVEKNVFNHSPSIVNENSIEDQRRKKTQPLPIMNRKEPFLDEIVNQEEESNFPPRNTNRMYYIDRKSRRRRLTL